MRIFIVPVLVNFRYVGNDELIAGMRAEAERIVSSRISK